MRTILAVGALALLSSPSLAAPAKGHWSTEFNQGILAYNLFGTASDKDMVSIQCAPDGASVAVRLSDRPTQLNHQFDVTIDREKFKLLNADGDLVATDTPVGANWFRHFWSRLRTGRTMTIRFDDGRVGHFSLAGAARVLPRKPCKTAL